MTTQEFYDAAFSSETGKWDTPADLLLELEPLFPWDLDVCADQPNVCPTFYNEARNGLADNAPWFGLCWMNPPYGTEIGAWINKARQQSAYLHNQATVCLLPARTDTDWFQRNVSYASQTVFIKGRLKFGSRDHWIRHYNARIMALGRADFKSIQECEKKHIAMTEKIGGALLDNEARVRLVSYLNEEKYMKWRHAEHLKPDAAPFPSCFIVFGHLSTNQQHTLAAFGWSIP